MAAFSRWLGSRGAWRGSKLFELPLLDDAVPADLKQWCALAGGLALILSRVSGPEHEAQFQVTRAVFLELRRCLKAGGSPMISRKKLAHVMQEIELVVDPLTRAAARSCARAPAPEGSTSPSQAALRRALETTRGSWPGIPPIDFDDQQTQLSPDVFMRRSQELRRAVAGARKPT